MARFEIYKKALLLTVVLFMCSTILWDYFHGGVPSHHFLADDNLPSFSNWWGLIIIPLTTYYLLSRITKRISKNEAGVDIQKKSIYPFFASLLYGITLSAFFAFGNDQMPEILMLGVIGLGFFVPLYKSEYVLGFMLGLVFTFGGVLPIIITSVLTLICFINYMYLRPIILKMFSLFIKLISNKQAK